MSEARIAEQASESDEQVAKSSRKAKAGKGAGRKTKVERPISPYARVKEMLIANPQLSVADIQKALDGEGLKISRATISTTRSSFLHTVAALQNAGLLKKHLL